MVYILSNKLYPFLLMLGVSSSKSEPTWSRSWKKSEGNKDQAKKYLASQVALVVKTHCQCRLDTRHGRDFAGLGRSLGEGQSDPLQRACLENPRGQRRLVHHSPKSRHGWTDLACVHAKEYHFTLPTNSCETIFIGGNKCLSLTNLMLINHKSVFETNISPT